MSYVLPYPLASNIFNHINSALEFTQKTHHPFTSPHIIPATDVPCPFSSSGILSSFIKSYHKSIILSFKSS